MRVLGTGIFSWRLFSPPKGLQSFWEASFSCRFPAAWRVVNSCLQCWQYKDCQELFPLGESSRTGLVGERRLFRIWGSGREGRVDLLKVLRPWLVTTADDVGFWRSRCKKFLPPLHFVEGIETRHQQPASFALTIVDSEVVAREFLGSADLSGA